ncbi:hypothetical protein, partial [Paenibacillus chibensis]|uniref:hypothetical protein n=2 Tax=Paenibacillus chibensis TaxID=59846 RepID=UPI003D2B54BD
KLFYRLLLNGQILAFAGLLAALSIILGIYNVVLVIPFTYFVDSLLKTRNRRSFYFSIILQGFIGIITGFALVSLFNKAFHWSYFFNVPCIMCGLAFPIVERWYTTEKGRKDGK